MSLVSSEWLEKNINKVKILDCSWHLPNVNRDPYNEYTQEHIANAIFFDLDKNSEQNTNLPHMLPDKNTWEKIISLLGIKNNDEVVIYDNSELISSCRLWYSFIYFGHKQNLVHVLDGGLKNWKKEKKPTTNKYTKIYASKNTTEEKKNLVINKKQIDNNILNKNFELVDARSKERFEGKEPEPRSDVKSGAIPNSFCLPFKELINENHTFKDKREIKKKFNNIFGPKLPKHVVFSCGSGITATVLALAYSLINNKYVPIIYDGSWAEYGKK